MITAGIKKLTAEGTNNAKKVVNSTMPFCQTISVVISPNGLNAPPALAATTMLIQANAINFVFLPPTFMTIAHINNAVVKLSAIGEMKKARIPVNQKIKRNVKPLLTIHARRESNNLRSSIALI